jgi:hypothetical protein
MKPKPRRTRAQACTGKKQHADKADDEEHRARLVRRGASAQLLRTYRCEFCGAYHVGHAMPKDR